MILNRLRARFFKEAYLLFFSLLITLVGRSQDVISKLPGSNEFLTSREYLPEDLLMTKSLVIIDRNGKDNDGPREDWKPLAEEAHPYMTELGIDPVLYVYADDIFSGPDAQRVFAKEFTDREIENLVFLTQNPLAGPNFELTITLFSDEVRFVKNRQQAWHYEENTLEALFRELTKTVDRINLVRENLLILDIPEYLREPQIIRGRRNESVNTDLRIDRLAIPRFPMMTAESADGTTPGDDEGNAQANRENAQKNADLEAIFSVYPYEHELVDYLFDEDKIRLKGFQFILMRLHTTGEMIRNLLNYEDDNSENQDAIVSTIFERDGRTGTLVLPPDQPVYKYYIKHIYTGDVYLGEAWDAAPTWQQALTNHLNAVLLKLGPDE